MELSQLLFVVAWIPLAAAFAVKGHRHCEPERVRQAIPVIEQLPLQAGIGRR